MKSNWTGSGWFDAPAENSHLSALLQGTPLSGSPCPTPKDSDAESVHVCILLAVLNGANTLPEQLESVAAQNHRNWHILASDDGSIDTSQAILDAFSRRYPVIQMTGPGQGSAANFLAMIRGMGLHAPRDSWLAFCDQDDVWLPDRLSRGISALLKGPTDQPAMFCSRTWITDHRLHKRRLSAAGPRQPSFANALVQNIAAGNTILLNPAATRLIRSAARRVDKVIVHDWWAYQLVTGAGGHVVHDTEPTLLYRQHPRNQIGCNDTLRARLRRARMMMNGVYRDWNDTNIAALSACSAYLTPETRATLTQFAELRRTGPLARLRALRKLGLYRHGTGGTLALWVSALLGRM